MKKTTKNFKSLEGIYKFMAQAYHGNWQYRWSETPWLKDNLKAKRNESIPGHQWACIGFWFYLSRICPALSALVDTKEIYERLWSHDLGETFAGDVSQFVQLKGRGVDKYLLERKEIEKMVKNVPKKIQKQMLTHFDEFEEDFEKMEKLEVLVAKFVDTLQGDHFAHVFGNDLPENSPMINKIVGRSTVSVVRELLRVLRERGHKRAHKEVVEILRHHLDSFKKAGIKINPDFYLR